MIGNWAGILLLVLAVPYVLDIALKFSSWEIALLFLWGVSICGTLTADEKPIKGWIAGWIGCHCFGGWEEIYGYERLPLEIRNSFSAFPISCLYLFGLTKIFSSSLSQRLMSSQQGGQDHPSVIILKYWCRGHLLHYWAHHGVSLGWCKRGHLCLLGIGQRLAKLLRGT
jgi:TctA family transporter